MVSLKYLLQWPLTPILAFILIISSWWNYTSVASADFNAVQVLLICSYVTAVIFLQIAFICCVYFALRRKTYNRKSAGAISGVFLAVNVLLLLLIHFEEFARLALVYQLIWFAASCFAFYALIDVMVGSRWMRRAGISIAILLLGYSVITSALSSQADSADVARISSAVNLSTKPNIYFLGLDALSPESKDASHY